MSKKITFTLLVGLMQETVVNETYKRGEIVKATDEKATKLAFHEQVDSDNYQKKLLDRNMFAAVEEVKTHIADFLSNNDTDTDVTTTYQAADTANNVPEGIVFVITVSGRYNKAYAPTLSRMVMKYIEDYMIMNWWVDIDSGLFQTYQGQIAADIVAINRCFHKTAPTSNGDYSTLDVTTA